MTLIPIYSCIWPWHSSVYSQENATHGQELHSGLVTASNYPFAGETWNHCRSTRCAHPQPFSTPTTAVLHVAHLEMQRWLETHTIFQSLQTRESKHHRLGHTSMCGIAGVGVMYEEHTRPVQVLAKQSGSASTKWKREMAPEGQGGG
jgi:hypothetical protein